VHVDTELSTRRKRWGTLGASIICSNALQKAARDATQELRSQQATEASNCSSNLDTSFTTPSQEGHSVGLGKDVSFETNSTDEAELSAEAAWQEIKEIIDDALHDVTDVSGSPTELGPPSVGPSTISASLDNSLASIAEAPTVPNAVDAPSPSLWSAITEFCQTASHAATEHTALGRFLRDTLHMASSIAKEIDHHWTGLPPGAKLTSSIIIFVASVVLLHPQVPFPSLGPSHKTTKGVAGEEGRAAETNGLAGTPPNRKQALKDSPPHEGSQSLRASPKGPKHAGKGPGLMGEATSSDAQGRGIEALELLLPSQGQPAGKGPVPTTLSENAQGEEVTQDNFTALWKNLRWMCFAMGNIGSMVPNGALQHFMATGVLLTDRIRLPRRLCSMMILPS
jgi:hypothetical protein